MEPLQGKTVVIYVENLYNDWEFWYPYYRMQEAGAKVVVAGLAKGAVYKSKYGMPASADEAFNELDVNEVDVLIIPGGYAPDIIRRHTPALEFVRSMVEQDKTVAFICHAGWVPISAGVVKGRTCTSFVAIKDDLVNAGARWVDEPVVVDGPLISSRTPDDLPVFCKTIIEQVS